MTQPAFHPDLLSLEPAIDRRPLTVSPETSVAEAIATMAKAQSSCTAPSLRLPYDVALKNQARAGTLYLVEGNRLVAQFGEAQAIAAISSGQNLAATSVEAVATVPAHTCDPAQLPDPFAALELLRRQQLLPLPLVDGQGHFSGVVTLETLRVALQLDPLLKDLPLNTALTRGVIIVSPQASALAVAQQMSAENAAYAVLLAAEVAQPPGLVLPQDILQLQRLGLDLSQIVAGSIMRTQLPRFAPTTAALVAYWEMQQHQAQQGLVVDEDDRFLGLATLTSCLENLEIDQIRAVESEIQQSINAFAQESAQSHRVDSVPLMARREAPVTVESLQEQLESSRLLAAMALHIRESLQLNEILQTAVNEVRHYLQTERVLIYKFNPDMSGTVVVESVAEGLQPALNSTVHDTCFGQTYAQAYQAGRTQVVEDIYAAGLTQCHIDILVIYDVRASLVVPILQGPHLWGLLCAYHCSGPKHWRSFEVDLLKQLAIHIAIAIQQSELYEQAQNELAERKRAEAQLKSSLREKEALLKEIHHRVKNNLQIISSVLRLQSDFVRDEKVMALFNDSQNRIRSMALIHEKLYQSRDLLRINMAEYIRDLTNNLLPSYATRPQKFNLQTGAESIWLNIDTAIPCGLIINELVSNAFKHAFPEPTNGAAKVWVTITQIESGQFTLTVKDNGIGFPPNLDFRNTESLGLELVCIFAEQLEGTIDLIAGEGTEFVITFSETLNDIGDPVRDS